MAMLLHPIQIQSLEPCTSSSPSKEIHTMYKFREKKNVTNDRTVRYSEYEMSPTRAEHVSHDAFSIQPCYMCSYIP